MLLLGFAGTADVLQLMFFFTVIGQHIIAVSGTLIIAGLIALNGVSLMHPTRAVIFGGQVIAEVFMPIINLLPLLMISVWLTLWNARHEDRKKNA